MPVFNSEKYISEAVNSILTQSFSDFEFIIINDASTDNTSEILNEITDARVIKIDNTTHKGNYRCRNQALQMAKGKYICVMDSDDISHIDRLAIQFSFLEDNADFVSVGSDIEFFNQKGESSLFHRISDKDKLKVYLLRDNVCTHPTLLLRRDILKKYKLSYNSDYYYSADYNLMVELSRVGYISNISEPLLKYRIHSNQISSKHNLEQERYADQIKLKQLAFFKINPSIEEIINHLDLIKEKSIAFNKLKQAEEWCNKLLAINDKLKIYNTELLSDFFEYHLNIALKNAF